MSEEQSKRIRKRALKYRDRVQRLKNKVRFLEAQKHQILAAVKMLMDENDRLSTIMESFMRMLKNKDVTEIADEYPFLRESYVAMRRLAEGPFLTKKDIEEVRLAAEYYAAGLPGGEGKKVFASKLRDKVSDKTLRNYAAKWQIPGKKWDGW